MGKFDSSNIKLLRGSGTSSDILTLTKPNSHGISFNSLDKFVLNGRSLKIINTGNFYGESNKAAQTIVIKSSNIQLNAEIELIGEPADIIFLSPQSVSCDGCVLKEFSRITFATANSTVNATSNKIGNLTPVIDKSVVVKNLHAPGALSVDILSDSLTLGDINTNLRANRLPQGGYEMSDSGTHTIGSGSINIFHGELTIDYENQKIIKVLYEDKWLDLTINDVNLTASTIKVASSGSIKFARNSSSDPITVLDTSANALSSGTYRGHFQPVQEGITLTAFNGVISNYGKIKTEGKLNLISGKMLFNAGELEATDIKIVTGTSIYNTYSSTSNTTGSIKAHRDLNVSSGKIYNQNNGQIRGHSIILATEQEIINQNSASIVGSDVELYSKNSIVRNGSAYSYEPDDDESLDKNINWLQEEDDLDIGLLGFTGLYEGHKLNFSPAALIFGHNVKIIANRFENINPYFVWKKNANAWDNGIPLNSFKSKQVAVYGENSLLIDAPKYVLNVSAVMGVNSESGLLRINSNFVDNERYRVYAFADYIQTDTEKKLVADLHFYSPPGFIYSFGNFHAKGNTGFTNNTGFFQVFGDATFDYPAAKVKSIGINMGDELREKITTQYFDNSGYCHYLQLWSTSSTPVDCPTTASTTTINNSIVSVDPKQQETLFHVAGNVAANQAELVLGNHDPLYRVKELALIDFARRDAKTYDEGRFVSFDGFTENPENGDVSINYTVNRKHCWYEKSDYFCTNSNLPVKDVVWDADKFWAEVKSYIDKFNVTIQRWIDSVIAFFS
ncbi:hypothetical protein [Pseudoalteromonas luteoviolacea]|uniref:Uncharacterized protein n=2 Tax=Pseudoalteromonas luteoviolacea TaxID=43657 RepID=A0A0F6ACR9_9GAMM|nr:hypothetical protein [Pseudoalteromonas luteoviolacea]KKE83204.1 hypothetical protein N479_15280 [Pseudoalteromonas luteoviolacea S4054]KZN68833.1 hypothetical protein N481_23090 [Pseudoalteromonas luteoviolacea S4047-1]AOT09537.1 hypothetical protein S4054249_17635 [Pseudoalteromonas luteoviolacea]AOT14449.1 hypothetical protein S40542_17605 [Pseudoalteromonas luteoviolacea]AOT19365.1 hypothetical protein S4054_17610 [Pseudoalteromonas luteoviolacea]